MLRTIHYLFPLATLGAVALPAGGAPVAGTPPKAQPRGELAKRIEMDRDRMLHGGIPQFTNDFILADVTLRPDYPRRFTNYSGDLSGRYIEALACMPGDNTKAGLDNLVSELIKHQRPDGRFGNPDLRYVAKDIGLDHMALLWGNGRLLVGLVENYASNPRPEVLASARKLGDFLLSVHKGCANDAVTAKVKDLAAAGMICFSQLIEGFVLLSNVSGEKSYLDGAKMIVPWLPTERGRQHSHGYLTTLRAILLLHEARHDAKYLSMVEGLYGDLVRSGDYVIYGGVQELFGGQHDRDEGCSEGDFLRLSLQLWRLTGKTEYLDRAEYCLLNHFYANQFSTGDFGHHAYADFGVKPITGVGRAWWCCTMHALRSFRDVLDSAVTTGGASVNVNLFTDVVWTDGPRKITVETRAAPNGNLNTTIAVQKTNKDGLKISVRRPAWTNRVVARINGRTSAFNEHAGYLTFSKTLKRGDRIEIACEPRCEIVKRDGTRLAIEALSAEPVEGVLRCGPWLMGVDEADNPMFFGEPWRGNRVFLSGKVRVEAAAKGLLEKNHLHVPCEYTHEGFPGSQELILRPISERAGHDPCSFAVWLKYSRQP
jgi:hypothetical protein